MLLESVTHIPASLPRQQKAILQGKNGTLELVDTAPLPHVPADRLLVKVVAVALNPCDWKMPGQFPSEGVFNGTDYAGVIVAIGPDVAKLPSKPGWRLGDEVFGGCHGANAIDPESGAFAQYLRADPELLFKKPSGMPWENAAAWGGSGITTLGLALFWDGGMGLSGSPNEPAEAPEKVLVYAGSTSVGTLAIQLLRIYGHVPLTTCSPGNFPLVTLYGAEKAWDYRSPSCGQEVKEYTEDELELVLDPITEAKSQRLCYQAMGRGGGKYVALEMWQDMNHTRKTIEPVFVMGTCIFGKDIPLGNGYGSVGDAEKRKFGIEFYRQVQTLFDGNRLKPHPIRVLPGAWRGILEGIELLRTRAVSAQKLVVFIDPA